MDKNTIIISLSLEELTTAIVEKLKAMTDPAPVVSPLDDELLTVKEVAKLLGVSLVTIHAWKKDNKLKYYRYGSRIRFKKGEVLQVEKYQKKRKV